MSTVAPLPLDQEQSGTTPAPAGAMWHRSEDEVLAELLVEDISIDGMCGVY
jgi:mycofactocin precursor